MGFKSLIILDPVKLKSSKRRNDVLFTVKATRREDLRETVSAETEHLPLNQRISKKGTSDKQVN